MCAQVIGPAVHLWGHEIAGLTGADELDDIEIGERVGNEIVYDELAAAYTSTEDSARAMTLLIVGRLASAGDPAVTQMLHAWANSVA